MSSPDPTLLSIWQSALEQPIGVVLQTNDSQRARQALYRARADANDERLNTLQILTSLFPDGDLLIRHNPRRASAPPAPDLGELPD